MPQLFAEGCVPASGDGRDMIDVTMNVTLPGDYLRKVDVMSMSHGLEIRVPFLGHRVLDLAAHIPHRFKYPRRNGGKLLLRKMLRQYLPEDDHLAQQGGLRYPAGYEPERGKAAGDRGDAHRP